MKSTLILAACITAIALAGGCSTTAGVGKDMESAGKAITKSSEDARK